MKICIIGKYPPIQGGVSSDTYWLAQALGERGHKVNVVTNAWEVEKEYREQIKKDELSLLEPKNVSVYSTINDFYPPILRSNYYTEKLMNLSLDVIRNKGADIIYSNYLLPYSVVGLAIKNMTKKPHIIRHAGSDIGRLYKSRFLKTIFIEALKNADKVAGGSKNMFRIFKSEGINTSKIVRVSPFVNTDYFKPGIEGFDLSGHIRDKDAPVFSYFGKISRLKKTYEFVNAASKIKDKKFTLLFVVGDGPRAQELKKYVISAGLKDKCVFLPFQPPWKVPSIMEASTCVVSPESEETPFLPEGTHYPKIAREAMACGKCVIIGKGVAKKGVYSSLVEGRNILIVDPNNPKDFKNKLKHIIDNPQVAEEIGKNAYEFSKNNENFNGHISKIENLFYSIVNNKV